MVIGRKQRQGTITANFEPSIEPRLRSIHKSGFHVDSALPDGDEGTIVEESDKHKHQNGKLEEVGPGSSGINAVSFFLLLVHLVLGAQVVVVGGASSISVNDVHVVGCLEQLGVGIAGLGVGPLGTRAGSGGRVHGLENSGVAGDPAVHQLGVVDGGLPDVALGIVREGTEALLIQIDGAESEDRDEEEDKQLQSGRDTVKNEVLETSENLTRKLDGINDHAEALASQNNVCGSAGSICRSRNGDTNIGTLERGGVVDTISGHAAAEAGLAEGLDNKVLVLRENLGEAVGGDNHLSVLLDKIIGNGTLVTEDGQAVRALDVGAHAKHAGGLNGNDSVVSSDHLDSDAVLAALLDGLLGVGTRRVEESENTEHAPVAIIVVLPGDS